MHESRRYNLHNQVLDIFFRFPGSLFKVKILCSLLNSTYNVAPVLLFRKGYEKRGSKKSKHFIFCFNCSLLQMINCFELTQNAQRLNSFFHTEISSFKAALNEEACKQIQPAISALPSCFLNEVLNSLKGGLRLNPLGIDTTILNWPFVCFAARCFARKHWWKLTNGFETRC